MKKHNSNKPVKQTITIKKVLFFATLFTIFLVLVVSIFSNKRFNSLHELLFELAGPMQKSLSGASFSVADWQKDYYDLVKVRDENKRLLAELQECRNQRYNDREALALNKTLRRLLDFKKTLDMPSISARVIGNDSSVWLRTITIDRGSRDGISKGMAVVNEVGVVGQVIKVSPNYAKVMLAIAPASSINAIIQRSRSRGIIKGSGAMLYRLEYAQKSDNIQTGDFVVSAGYGGVFPTGLPIGVVSRVDKQKPGMFLDVEVTPVVNFLTLENLLVITGPNESFDNIQ